MIQQASARAWLRQMLGEAADFREGQWEAIDRIANERRRLLVVQRTGWGKSIVYFIAARLLRDQGAGCALLISPLLALMRNQNAAAERIGVHAETINSRAAARMDDLRPFAQAQDPRSRFRAAARRTLGAAIHRVHSQNPCDGAPEDPPKQLSAGDQLGECVRRGCAVRSTHAGAARGRYGGFRVDYYGIGVETSEGRRRSGVSICLGRFFG